MKIISVGETNDLWLHAIEVDGKFYPLKQLDLMYTRPDAKIYYDSGIYPGITFEELPQYICNKAESYEPEVSAAAAALGRKGGSVVSAAKTAAARANANMPPAPGKKPRGRPRKETE